MKFITVEARKNLLEFGTVEKVDDTTYLLTSAGKFLVEVTGFDPEKGIDKARLEVVVGEPIVPDPTDPTDPLPPPSGKYSQLTKFNKTLLDGIKDPLTRTQLKAAITKQVNMIEDLCNKSQCPTMDTAKFMVVQNGIKDTLLSRKDPELDIAWKELWRVPIQNELNKYPETNINLKDYVAAWKALLEGM